MLLFQKLKQILLLVKSETFMHDFEKKMHAKGGAHPATKRRLKHKLGGIVQPKDDRTEICSDANPYGKVVRIIYKDSSAVCTGTLVSPKHVLTAGHCLYNYDSETPANNGWLNIKGVLFTPCKNNKMKTKDPPIPTSYNDAQVDREWTWVRTVKGWTQKGKWQYDYGMIELSSVTNRGWMSFGYDDQLPNYSFNMNGFPGLSAPQGTGDDDDLKLTDRSIVYWTGFELAHDYDKTYVIEDKLMAYYMNLHRLKALEKM